jgi:predicted DCC family thiol-disulfide oxidoreductase YuxK
VYTEANAFAAVMQQLGGLWSVLAMIRFVPGPLKNPVYRVIARNRYRLFGRHDTCMVPDADLRARFLPDGYTTT